MIPLPSLSKCALFLDVDGTLAEIQLEPNAVLLDEWVQHLLTQLYQQTQQSCTLVSGRDFHDLRHLANPLNMALISCHGARIHLENDELFWQAPIDTTRHLSLTKQAQEWIEHQTALHLEVKSHSIAIHYRKAPSLEQQVQNQLLTWQKQYLNYEVLQGKMVKELRLRGIDKGKGICHLMLHPTFRGKIPVMVGDDITDEAAFRWVNSQQGISIKVGHSKHASEALFHLTDPNAVKAHLHHWLNHSLD